MLITAGKILVTALVFWAIVCVAISIDAFKEHARTAASPQAAGRTHLPRTA